MISFDKILTAYLLCPIKASLIQQAVKGYKSYILEIDNKIIKRNKDVYLNKIDRDKIISYNYQLFKSNENNYNKYEVITNLIFTAPFNSGIIDAIEISQEDFSTNLTLISFAPQQKITLIQRYVITYLAIIFESNTGLCIDNAK